MKEQSASERGKRNKRKVLACLELCMDVLMTGKTAWEAEAYQKIGKVMFELDKR